MKEKIAISIDRGLLQLIDSKVDKVQFKSRSQVIEQLVGESIGDLPLATAVILIDENGQGVLVAKARKKSLIIEHLDFLHKYGLREAIIVTPKETAVCDKIATLAKGHKVKVSFVYGSTRGNAHGLQLLQKSLHHHFLVLQGDSLNDCDLSRMYALHLDMNKPVTLGLDTSMGKAHSGTYGTVVMEGHEVMSFKETKDPEHYLVNAGIYVCSPQVFGSVAGCKRMETDVFPKLARDGLMVGYLLPNPHVHYPQK